MKVQLKLILFVSLMVLFQQCTDEQNLQPKKISIAFTVASTDDASSIENLSDKNILLITVANQSGDIVMQNQEIAFSKTGNTFTTEALDLLPGNYVINDFMVVSKDDDNIQLAAPLHHASLASAVLHPLAYAFKVSTDGNADVTLQVLKVGNHRAEEFGYKIFCANHKTFNLAVYSNESSKPTLIAAEAFIMKGTDTIQQYKLRAKVNQIPFHANPHETFTLVVIKDGYSRYAINFTLGELWKNQHQKPIQAVLSPAFTMAANTEASGYFAFEMDGYHGAVVIDWGDDTAAEPVLIGDASNVDMVQEHNYGVPGKYFISVTGGLDKIANLYFGTVAASYMDRINISRLIALDDIRFVNNHAPDMVDASHNDRLTFLGLYQTDAKHVKISPTGPPRNIEFENSAQITTESIEGVIDDLYSYVIRTGIGGNYLLLDYITLNPYVEHFIGFPSAETFNKMRILQNDWNCNFVPVIPD